MPELAEGGSVEAFVISFDPDVPKFAHLRGRHGIDRVHVVEAVVASGRPEYTTRPRGLLIGPGAAGCYLAHWDLWRLWSSRSGSPDDLALVLEDDAEITPYGTRWMDRVVPDARQRGFTMLQLGTHRTAGTRALHPAMSLGNRLRVGQDVAEARLLQRSAPHYSKSFGWGTHAYLVSRGFAGWLAAATPEFVMPIDCWLRALAQVPQQRIYRTRQDLWVPSGQVSRVDELGR